MRALLVLCLALAACGRTITGAEAVATPHCTTRTVPVVMRNAAGDSVAVMMVTVKEHCA